MSADGGALLTRFRRLIRLSLLEGIIWIRLDARKPQI